MKSITLFLLVAWVCCVLDLSFAQIEIKQWLDKAEYVEGEPVFLFARAKNFSNISVDFALPSATTEIHIYDNQSKRYGPTITYHYVNVANLFPDSVYESFVDLASKYGENTGGLFFPYFRKGTYYVYLCWKDKGMQVTTPKIYFMVKNPDERQQKIFDEFLKVLKIRQTKEGRSQGKTLMRELLEKYFSTIYTPSMYHLLLIYYSGEKVAFDLADQFIHTYPDHPNARTSLIYVTTYFKRSSNKEAAIQYYTQLMNENLNPDLNRLIERNYFKRIRALPIEDW